MSASRLLEGRGETIIQKMKAAEVVSPGYVPLRLKRSDEQLPEEFGRALKGQPFFAVSVRLHAQSFEIDRLLVGPDHHCFVHASIGEDGEFISFQTSYRFPHVTLTTSSTLRFPSREQVETLIASSGLVVRNVFGAWDAGPFEAARSREIIFIAEIAG